MISRSRRDSVGGGSSRIFPAIPRADAIQWGGGSSRIFPATPRADAIQWGGVVAEFFRDLRLRNQMFTPYSWVQAHILLRYDQNSHFFRENYFTFKFPQFRELSLQFRDTWRSRAFSGDSRKFRETWQVWVLQRKHKRCSANIIFGSILIQSHRR